MPRKVLIRMIHQNYSVEQSKTEISFTLTKLRVAKLLQKANIRKACGVSVVELFQFLLMLAFYGKNLFRVLTSDHKRTEISKNTFYRFLNTPTYNWKRFLVLLAVRVTDAFGKLTNSNRVKVLILDDSVTPRQRSKAVELLARIHDHVFNRYVKGFNMLTLGWSDGFSFVPVAFNLLSSAKPKNRYQEASNAIDHRTSGWKARMDSMLTKPEAAFQMIKYALDMGIKADYVLMDSWFTTEPFVKSLTGLGIHVIGMVKQLTQTYLYNGRYYTLPKLARLVMDKGSGRIYRSIVVKTKRENIPVRLVFVRNRNKISEHLYLMTTDIAMSDAEVIRLYGNRWSIETFFKASKSLLKLQNEFQTRSYDAAVAHTAIVFTRYTVLEWIRRDNNDSRTYGGLFFALCDEVQDIEFAEALKSLMELLTNIAMNFDSENTSTIKSKVTYWINSQPRFIKALLPKLGWES